jgi:uncharacterized protein YbbC (DUF1343 family)
MHQMRFAGVKWWLSCGATLACAGVAVRSGTPRIVRVQPGIDVLLADSTSLVRDRRVGLVTNIAAVDAHGVGDIARLREAGVMLVALFAPEHGLTESAAPGQAVRSSVDSNHVPIYSLYGRTAAPTDSMLAGVDVMLVDLPDVGARYYTYLATTINVMRAAGSHHIPVVILDRPDPLGGAVQGNVLDPAYRSAVGALAVPMQYGLTLGEEARLAQADLHIAVDLRVVPVRGWSRAMTFDRTGLPFRAPSPNLQSLDAVFDYPGTCLFEGTALSVGRGTDHAYAQIGAPWLDTTAVLAQLRAIDLPGVAFSSDTFTPHAPGDGKFADTTVSGIRLRITDRARFDSPATAVAMLFVIHALQPTEIRIGGSFDRLAGGPALREALQRGDSADAIVRAWQPALAAYRERVRPYLLYQPAPYRVTGDR